MYLFVVERSAVPTQTGYLTAGRAAGPATSRRAGAALTIVLVLVLVVQAVTLDEPQIRAPHTLIGRLGR